jgi:ketosteroid isomerase-like protein
MEKILEEVNVFLKEYEVATNSHVFDNVRPLITEDAVYWFSDGTHVGIKEIEDAFTKTFNKIQDEVYTIKDVKWISLGSNSAVCIYKFYWRGTVDGKPKEGNGRGTNVLRKLNEKWMMAHEHLSLV